jgi:Acetyltransferase (GNAT) domain
MMEYEKVSEKEWEEIILKSDNAYFFSSPTWAKIIEKSFDEYRTATRLYHINGKSILIPMMEKNTHGKKIYGFKSFESMPEEGFGGLFSESEITTNDFRSIVEDIIGSRHTFYLALSPFENPFENKFSPGKSTTKIKDEWNIKDIGNYTHIINLEGKNFEDIKNNYRKDTKRKIRKAIKSGVEIRDGTSLDDFRAFYNIWSKASQNWEYQETHSFKFFHNLHKYGSPHVKLSLATKDNKTIAGLISLHYTKTIYHAFMAYKEEYGTFNPTRILFNDSIKQACQEEYKHIDFGSSGKLDGVRRIKEGFRAEKVETKKYLALSNVAKILQKINKSL